VSQLSAQPSRRAFTSRRFGKAKLNRRDPSWSMTNEGQTQSVPRSQRQGRPVDEPLPAAVTTWLKLAPVSTRITRSPQTGSRRSTPPMPTVEQLRRSAATTTAFYATEHLLLGLLERGLRS